MRTQRNVSGRKSGDRLLRTARERFPIRVLVTGAEQYKHSMKLSWERRPPAGFRQDLWSIFTLRRTSN